MFIANTIQVLFLESIYQTAEVKYSAVILLINSIKPTLRTFISDSSIDITHADAEGLPINPLYSVPGNDSSSSGGSGDVLKWSEVLSYMDSVQSTCYINMAVCMVHHSVRLRMISTATTGTSTNTLNTPLSVNDLVFTTSSTSSTVLHTPLHYLAAGLHLCDTLSGRFRKLYVLEKMHRYRYMLLWYAVWYIVCNV